MHCDSVSVSLQTCVPVVCVCVCVRVRACCDLILCSGVLLDNESYTGAILSVLNGSIRLMCLALCLTVFMIFVEYKNLHFIAGLCNLYALGSVVL